MLSEKEIHKVKKYSLYPKIAIAAVLVDFIICGYFLLLVMLDDLAFKTENRLYKPGIYLFLVFIIVYMVIFCYGMLYTKLGRKNRKEWKEIVRKADVTLDEKDHSSQVATAVGLNAAGHLMSKSKNETVSHIGSATEIAGAVDTIEVASEIAFETVANAQKVADAFQIQLPKAKKYIIPIVLIPFLTLTAVFIPEYKNSIEVRDQYIQLASESIETLESSFETGCVRVSVDDPSKRYNDNYTVTAYLYGLRSETQDHRKVALKVGLDKEGRIDSVMYSSDIDLNKTAQENLEQIQNEFSSLQNMLSNANIKTLTSEVVTEYQLSDEFKEKFLTGNYYEKIDGISQYLEHAQIYDSFDTKPKDELGEHDYPGIWHYVKYKK